MEYLIRMVICLQILNHQKWLTFMLTVISFLWWIQQWNFNGDYQPLIQQLLHIQVTPLSDERFKISKPALHVNGHAKVLSGLLFNPAYLRGQHEPAKRWKESRTIDVYNINKQEYIGSIYIDLYKDSEVSDFTVTDKHLYVIAGNQLIQYRLTNSLIKYFKNGVAENDKKELLTKNSTFECT